MKRYLQEDKVLESIFNTLDNGFAGFDLLIRDVLYEKLALGVKRISMEPVVYCEEPPFIYYSVEKGALTIIDYSKMKKED